MPPPCAARSIAGGNSSETDRVILTPEEPLRYLPAMPPINEKTYRFLTSASFALAGLLILSGCGKDEAQYVEVQEIKETPPAVQEMPHAHAHEDAGIGISYTVPDGWSEKAPSRMVLASFQAGEPPQTLADMSVSSFPGDVGGQLANINRWRRQVGLGPIDPDAVSGFVTDMEVGGLPAWQVSFTGPIEASKVGEPVRMVVTAVSHEGKTWFFKFMGGESAVAGELDNYQAFLKSVRF